LIDRGERTCSEGAGAHSPNREIALAISSGVIGVIDSIGSIGSIVGSLIGGFAPLPAPISFIFYCYGELIWKRFKFAPTPEKSVDERQETKGEQDPSWSDSSSLSDTGSNMILSRKLMGLDRSL